MKQNKTISRILLLIIVLFTSAPFSVQAQQAINGYAFKNMNVKDFPKVRGELWVRDWNGIKTQEVDFFEENSTEPLKPSFSSHEEATDSLANNKCIVFLVLNPGNNGLSELSWYKTVLKNAIQNGNVKKGDKIAVLNYNNQIGGQLIFPSHKLEFTDDIKAINKMIDEIKPRDVKTSCQVGTNLLKQSIEKTLSSLESQFIRMPKGIVILSDDYNCFGNDPTNKARQLDVSIYSIIYGKNVDGFNTIRETCNNTYGIHFSDPGRDITRSVNKLNDYLKKFLQRQSGLNYSFSYESKYDKDGSPHTLTMNYNGVKTPTRIDVPSKNILEWVVANPILASIFFVVLVLVVVLVVLLVSKNKKQRQMEKVMEQQRILEAERKHKESEEMLSSKLSAQQQELDAIKKKEAFQKEQEMKRKAQEEEKKRESELIMQMKMKGNYAWLDYSTGNGSKQRFEIRQPVVVVGRDASCTLVVDLPTVSKKHLQLNYTTSNEYWVKDLGSSNGLYVNGQKVQQAQLKHGDFIQAGELVLNFFI